MPELSGAELLLSSIYQMYQIICRPSLNLPQGFISEAHGDSSDASFPEWKSHPCFPVDKQYRIRPYCWEQDSRTPYPFAGNAYIISISCTERLILIFWKRKRKVKKSFINASQSV